MENSLNVVIECIDCKESFEANGENVKQQELKDEDKIIKVIYVDCPHCNRRHYVQIDNDESSKLKVQNLLMFKKLSRKKLNGKQISKKENTIFKNLRDKLLDLRADLMEEYEGRIVTDTLTGESITLHFTLC